jgi:hypothetical protein
MLSPEILDRPFGVDEKDPNRTDVGSNRAGVRDNMTNGITQEQEQETNTVVPSRSSTQNAPEENITEILSTLLRLNIKCFTYLVLALTAPTAFAFGNILFRPQRADLVSQETT